MPRIPRFVSYVCMFQVIFQHFGTLAATVSINQNITGLVGNKDTHLTCSFILEKSEEILNVLIMAKNITEGFDDKKPFVIFEPEKAARLLPPGTDLVGRVTLTNITNISADATLTIHVLKCTDEKDYMCKIAYHDNVKVITIQKSTVTRISVKAKVRDVYTKNEPNQKQYDERTDNITLTCKASGDPEPTYIWFKEDNSSSILSRTNLYVLKDVIRNNSGVYICQAYNSINNITYSISSSIFIDIVDELLSPQESVSLKISAVTYAVSIIIAVGLIVIFLSVVYRKSCWKQAQREKNKESRWQNMVHCFIGCGGCGKKPKYTPVVRKNNPATVESGDDSNGLKENKISCRNKEMDLAKTVDIIQSMPTDSSKIYADPKDTLPLGIVKDIGKYENHRASDQSVVYSEVIDQANMKYEMSNSRTSVPPDTVAHNDHDMHEDQCHV